MKSIAFVPMTENFDLERFSSMFSKAINKKSTVLTSKNICKSNSFVAQASYGTPLESTLLNVLESIESQSSTAVYIADNTHSGWTSRCIERAERVFLVGDYEMEELTSIGKSCLMNEVEAKLEMIFEYPNKNVFQEEKITFLAPKHIKRQHHMTAFNVFDIEQLIENIQIAKEQSHLEIIRAAA